MMFYNPSDWYWVVAGNSSVVWSSKARSYLAIDNQTYIDWVAKGGFPTRILSEPELWDVLTAQYPNGLPPPLNLSPIDNTFAGDPWSFL